MLEIFLQVCPTIRLIGNRIFDRSENRIETEGKRNNYDNKDCEEFHKSN